MEHSKDYKSYCSGMEKIRELVPTVLSNEAYYAPAKKVETKRPKIDEAAGSDRKEVVTASIVKLKEDIARLKRDLARRTFFKDRNVKLKKKLSKTKKLSDNLGRLFTGLPLKEKEPKVITHQSGKNKKVCHLVAEEPKKLKCVNSPVVERSGKEDEVKKKLNRISGPTIEQNSATSGTEDGSKKKRKRISGPAVEQSSVTGATEGGSIKKHITLPAVELSGTEDGSNNDTKGPLDIKGSMEAANTSDASRKASALKSLKSIRNSKNKDQKARKNSDRGDISTSTSIKNKSNSIALVDSKQHVKLLSDLKIPAFTTYNQLLFNNLCQQEGQSEFKMKCCSIPDDYQLNSLNDIIENLEMQVFKSERLRHPRKEVAFAFSKKKYKSHTFSENDIFILSKRIGKEDIDMLVKYILRECGSKLEILCLRDIGILIDEVNFGKKLAENCPNIHTIITDDSSSGFFKDFTAEIMDSNSFTQGAVRVIEVIFSPHNEDDVIDMVKSSKESLEKIYLENCSPEVLYTVEDTVIPNLRNLSITWFTKEEFTCLLSLVEHRPLSELHMSTLDFNLSSPNLIALANNLPDLKSLSLTMDPKDVAKLNAFKALEEVRLEFFMANDSGYEDEMAKFMDLYYLNHQNADSNEVAKLETALESEFYDPDVNKENLIDEDGNYDERGLIDLLERSFKMFLARRSLLKKLSIKFSNNQNATLLSQISQECPNLEMLHLRFPVSTLKALDIYSARPDAIGFVELYFESLLALTQLRSLMFEGVLVSDLIFTEFLDRFKNLEHLRLCHCVYITRRAIEIWAIYARMNPNRTMHVEILTKGPKSFRVSKVYRKLKLIYREEPIVAC